MNSRKVVEHWLEAFRQRDLSMLHLAKDFVHHSPFGAVRGRQAYLDLVRGNEEAFFSPVLETLDIIAEGTLSWSDTS